MKHTFRESITRENDWSIAQCLEIDVASQGQTEDDALTNLGEAIALYFIPPVAQRPAEPRQAGLTRNEFDGLSRTR